MLATLLLILTPDIYSTEGKKKGNVFIISFFLINCINMLSTGKDLLNPMRICSVQKGKCARPWLYYGQL